MPLDDGSGSVVGASWRLALADRLSVEQREHLVQLLIGGENFAHLRGIAALIRVMLQSESTEASAYDAFGPRRVGHLDEIPSLEFGFNGGDGLAAASEEPVEVFPGNTLKIFAAMLAVAQNHRARLHRSVLSTFLNTARFCRYVNLRFTSGPGYRTRIAIV